MRGRGGDARLRAAGETLVYPAHDYKGMTVSSIGEEMRHNLRLGGGRSRHEFVELMASLGLPPPAKIAEALPANRACGEEREAERGVGA